MQNQEQNALIKAGPTAQEIAEYEASMDRALQVVEIQTDQGPVKLTPSIVRRYLAVGEPQKFTDGDLTLFLAMCKFHQLNPFIREVWPIKFGNNLQIVVAKDTFIKRAASDPDIDFWRAGIIVWDGESKKYYDTQGIIPPGTELLGGWCEVVIKGQPHPLRLEVNLEEYDLHQSLWGSGNAKGKKATMIRKVAIVQALREASPNRTRKMYIPDEMGLDPDKLPEGAIDVTQVQAETGGGQPSTSQQPPNGNGTAQPSEDTPSGNFPRRSRRNRFTGLNKEQFPYGKIDTCGIRPEQYLAIEKLITLEENAIWLGKYLTQSIGYPDPTYLREEEALYVLQHLKSEPVQQSAQEPAPAQQYESPEFFEENLPKSQQVVNNTASSVNNTPSSMNNAPPAQQTMAAQQQPQQNTAATNSDDDPMIDCPMFQERYRKSYCLNNCRTRKQDGFCLAIGEKPPASGMFGGR